MKKISLIILIILLCLFGLFKIANVFLNSEIKSKEEMVNENWRKLYLKNKETNSMIKTINSSLNYLDNDSLNEILLHHEKAKECSLEYVEFEYAINKVINKITADSLINQKTKKKIEYNIIELNNLVSNYNIAVKNYNTFIRGFPINIYAYKKYATKVYFDLEYGVANENPKTKYEETPDWMSEIEKAKGYE